MLLSVNDLHARYGRIPPCPRIRRGLGYVPQGREIFPGLSVRDNLRMGFAGRGAEERIDVILETFPRLAPLLDRRGGTLSGGEQQLHEPTEGIQPSIIEELLAVLQHLHRTQGLTILLVEQNLQFIAELSKRVLLIQKGTILRELQPADLRQADVLNEFVGVSISDTATPRTQA